MAKEALYRRETLGASQLIRTLMGEIAGQHSLELKFCEMYTLIIKAQPDFQIALSEDQVFCTFAPPQLKNTVGELFQQLKIQVRLAGQQTAEGEEQKGDFISMVQQDGEVSKLIADKLEEIFFEDTRFNAILLWYLTESTDYCKVIRPYYKHIKPLKILQQEHLEIAFSQVDSKGSGPQRIAEFMAVDIDMDLQALQVDIGKWYIT